MKNDRLEEADARWGQLFHIVREQFPYCKMRGVAIKDGAVVTFKEVQCTYVFGRGIEPQKFLLPESFDDQWRRFARFCREIQDGVLDEVRFADGRPVAVSMERPGMKLADHSLPERIGKGGENPEKTLVAA